MKERPILFKGPLVRAILEGRKTQTRRPVKSKVMDFFGDDVWFSHGEGHSGEGWYCWSVEYSDEGSAIVKCPYGQPGDVLWVRETHVFCPGVDGDTDTVFYPATDIVCACDLEKEELDIDDQWEDDAWQTIAEQHKTRPSIHMPKWACRLWLKVTDVRIERLQDITLDKIKDEGLSWDECNFYPRPDDPAICSCGKCKQHHYPAARDAFFRSWDRLYRSKGFGCQKNPWVWVIEFERKQA